MRRLPRWGIDAVWAVGLLTLLALHFWFPVTLPGPGHDTYSTAADGKKAFFQLVTTLHGGDVQRNHALFERVLQGAAARWNSSESRDFGMFCILGPERQPGDEEWSVLLRWVAGGGHLVYAPRHDVFANREQPAPLAIQGPGGLDIRIVPWSEQRSTGDSVLWTGVYSNVDAELLTPTADTPQPQAWKSTAKIEATDAVQQLVIAEQTLQAIRIPYGRGTLTVLASDWVFSNESLSWPPNSLLAYRLLESSQAPRNVVFDEYLNETGVPRVLGLFLSPRFRPLTIQVIVLVYLFCWWQSHRFGPVLAPLRGMRHNIVEHTDAVGTLHYRARNGRVVVQAYLQQLVNQLHLKRHKGHEERVLEPIAVRLQTTSGRVLQLLRSIQQQCRREEVIDRKTTAEQIRRLARIRQAARPE